MSNPKSDRKILAEQYPLLFSPCGRGFRKKPLKQMIEADLLQRGLMDRDGYPMDLDRIRAAVTEYMQGAKYAHCLARGGARYDLDGKPAGWVSKITRERALMRIERLGWQNWDGHRDAA